MDVEEFRQYCLSLGDVAEKMPFGKFAARYDSILAFYAEGHMFCFIDIDDFTYVDLKAEPEKVVELRQTRFSVGAPINGSLKHWVKIDFGGDVPMKEALGLVKEAYSLVAAKYRRKNTL